MAKDRRTKTEVLSPEMKEVVREIDERMQRHVGVLSEEYQSRLSAVAEQMGGLNHRIDIVSDHLDILTERVDDLAGQMNTLVAQVSRLATAVEGVQSETESIKKAFQKKIGYDEFVALEQRVRMLESRR